MLSKSNLDNNGLKSAARFLCHSHALIASCKCCLQNSTPLPNVPSHSDTYPFRVRCTIARCRDLHPYRAMLSHRLFFRYRKRDDCYALPHILLVEWLNRSLTHSWLCCQRHCSSWFAVLSSKHDSMLFCKYHSWLRALLMFVTFSEWCKSGWRLNPLAGNSCRPFANPSSSAIPAQVRALHKFHKRPHQPFRCKNDRNSLNQRERK